MAINLSGLSTFTTAATALSNLVVVTPQTALGYVPQSGFLNLNNDSISYSNALVFDYEGEQTVELHSDITDHYIEDNTAVQDQVSLNPIRITTHGFIGELNDIAPYGLQTLQKLASKLTVISAYTPQLSTTALIAYNEAFLAYQLAVNAQNAAVSAWASISKESQQTVIAGNSNNGNITGAIQNRQQTAFQQFYGYWNNRTFFTIQTPWAVFVNMVIEDLRAIQDEKTNTITDFHLTFKQIRLAVSQTVSNDQAQLIVEGRLQALKAANINNGNFVAEQLIDISFGSLL